MSLRSVAMWKLWGFGVEVGKRVEEKKKKRWRIETVGHGNCSQGQTEQQDHIEEPGNWEEETKGGARRKEKRAGRSPGEAV